MAVDTRRLTQKVNAGNGSSVITPADLQAMADEAVATYARNAPTMNTTENMITTKIYPSAANDNIVGEIDEALADIARESTQQSVVHNIERLVADTEEMSDIVLDSSEENVKHLSTIERLMQQLVMTVNTGLNLMTGTTRDQLADLYDVSSDMSSSLDTQARIDAERLEEDRRDAMMATSQDHDPAMTFTEYAEEFLGGLTDVLKDMADTIHTTIVRILENGEHLSIMDNIKNYLIKMSVSVAGLIVATSGLLDLIVNPEGLSKYWEAFGNIWTAITDVFSDFTTELSSWWGSEGEAQFNVIGAFLNDVLIYFFGTLLPANIRFISDIILGVIKFITAVGAGLIELGQGLTTWDFSESISLIASGLSKILNAIVNGIVYFGDAIITWILRIFNLDEALGMGEDQSFGERVAEVVTNFVNSIIEYIKGLYTSIVEFFSQGITKILSDIGGFYVTLLDNFYTAIVKTLGIDKLLGMTPGQSLFERIKQLVDIVLDFFYDMIPSRNDIARMVNGALDSMELPDWISNRLRMEITPEEERPAQQNETPPPLADSIIPRQNEQAETPMVQPAPVEQGMLQKTERFIEEKTAAVQGAVSNYIDARRIDNSVNSVSSTAQAAGRAGGPPTTRSEPSALDRILLGNSELYRSP